MDMPAVQRAFLQDVPILVVVLYCPAAQASQAVAATWPVAGAAEIFWPAVQYI
jgi:hypothetical protein